MTKLKFKCNFAEAKTIAALVADSCDALLPQFSIISPAYDATFITTFKAAIIAAAAMPDQDARRSTTNLLRDELLLQNDIMISQYLQLDRCLPIAFPTNTNAQRILAGYNQYKKALEKDWDATDLMATMMASYIPANSAALLNNNNMNPAFPPAFLLKKADYTTAHLNYKQAQDAAIIATEAKTLAFNALYDTIIQICRDAKLLSLPATTLIQFQLKHLYQQVKGTKPSGVEGYITSFATGKGIPYATLKFGTTTVQADKNGKYKILLDKGNHYGLVEANTPSAGTPYIAQPVMFPVSKGTISTMNIQLLQ